MKSSPKLSLPIGHAASVRLLQAAVLQQRIHNAYLFVGPDGIGKRTLARWFAEQLLAVPKQQRLPLNGHPDFYTLEPLDPETKKRSVVKVDAVKAVLGYLRQHPLKSQRSVILVDQADAMTPSAANALLKTLEEPRKAVLLLTTERPDALLTTVKSRCQTLYLEPLSAPECEAVLAPYVSQALQKLVALAPGQPGLILQHCRTVNALDSIQAALEQGVQTPHECLQLAQTLSALTPPQQVWLLQWWQRISFDQPHLLSRFDQAIAQLQQEVQPELLWGVLLIGLSENGGKRVVLQLPAPVGLQEPQTDPVIDTEPPLELKLKKQNRYRAVSSGGDCKNQPKTVNVETVSPPGIRQISLFKNRPCITDS